MSIATILLSCKLTGLLAGVVLGFLFVIWLVLSRAEEEYWSGFWQDTASTERMSDARTLQDVTAGTAGDLKKAA